MNAEDVHRAGSHPVEEGWLVEEADAVDIWRDVVVALHHLAGDFDVDGVDVVEEAGGEEAADLEDEPCEDEDRDGAWAPEAGGCGLVVGSQCQFSVSLISWFIQWAVSVEGFAGGFFEQDFVVAEEVVDFVMPFDGDEEDFALAFAPDFL